MDETEGKNTNYFRLYLKENYFVAHLARINFCRPSKVKVVLKMSSTVLRKSHLNVLKIIIFPENSLDSLSPFWQKKQMKFTST